MIRKYVLILCAFLGGYRSWGQDLHYADIQTMNIWYNQSLKMDHHADVRFNFRDIKYQSILAFRTASGLLNIPLINKEKLKSNNCKGFLNITAGGAFDKSNKGIFKNSTGLFGISYSQLLSDNQVYLSAGFQGAVTQIRLGAFGLLFPDQFDQFGPLPDATRDPLKAGRSYGITSLNAGLSVFQNTSVSEWYVGGSLRHINRPFTDEQKTNAYRLAPTAGFQAGLTVKNENEQIGVYGIANLKAKAYEYLIGARFVKILDAKDDNISTLSLGVALRLNDAVIPNLQLQLKKTTIGFHYDMNISGLRAAGYSREGFEIALKQRIN